MKIRSKIILLVLPLISTPLILAAIISTFTARNSITAVATQFLQFKAEGIVSYADAQWSILEERNLQNNSSFVEAVVSAIESFAVSSIRSDSELIFAISEDGTVKISTHPFEPSPEETGALIDLISAGRGGWQNITIQGLSRVANVAVFEPLGWYLFVTEERDTFYSATNRIIYQMGIILAVSLIIGLIMLLYFAVYLTKPLVQVSETMTDVIRTRDMTQRVRVQYNDETGALGHTFNLMLSELEKANDNIKSYAIRAAVAKSQEQKIRNIFQKYVPKEVIGEFFRNPESMLVGDNRVLAVLFTDIRDFTALSEKLLPDEVVESLNQYFSLMVDSIMDRHGIVDKYMGDAIMAFFGAPVKHDNDALQSVYAALDMIESLKDFNIWQRQRGRPEFRTGIGINYGAVTLGNIGSEKKMEYTVIGDMVNLASRLEGLTKQYLEPLIVSDSVRNQIGDELPCRLLDKVIVKGKSISTGIYTVKRRLVGPEQQAWSSHAKGMELYYARDFKNAYYAFGEAFDVLPSDRPSRLLQDRCQFLIADPPPKSWTGAIEMDSK